MVDLAEVKLIEKKFSEAEAILRAGLTKYELTGLNTFGRNKCQSLFGASLAAQRKFPAAEPLLISAYESMIQRKATLSDLKEAHERILQLYRDWGKPDKAAEWAQKLEYTKKP